MQKIATLLLVLLVVILPAGCGKEFLELAPLDQGSVNLSFKNPEDANRAVLGIYDAAQQGMTDLALLTERTTDNATSQASVGLNNAGGNIRELIFYQFTSENAYMRNAWNNHYAGIAAANQVVDRIEGISFANETLKAQYIGEAKFLRAYFYFNLVRFFGAIPVSLAEIKDPAQAFALPRTPEAEVYEVISQDLADAITKLPLAHNATHLGRATQGAAKALLAKVYLTGKKPALALPLLRELTTAPYTYRLMANYPDVFSADNTPESIFEIQFLSGLTTQEGNSLVTFFMSNDATVGRDIYGAGYVGANGGGLVVATNDLYNNYTAADARRSFNFLVYRSNAERANLNLVRKYHRLPATGLGGSDDNVIILRYADVLLMLAEAINETNQGPTPEAYEAVDKVRLRAKIPALARDLTYESFKTQLLEERRLELAFEFHRWFDLKRFGKLVEVLKAKGYPIQPFHTLFPVPRSQVDINPANITQNPGYN